jgi:hypothetical protein
MRKLATATKEPLWECRPRSSPPDKVAVAAEFVNEKTRNMTIQEDVNGRLSSVEVAIGSGVTRPVYEPDHKIKDVLHAGARIQF